MRKQIVHSGRHTLTILMPDATPCGMIYIPMHGDAEALWKFLPSPRAAVAAISGFDWNRDLSPWPADAVFGEEGFAGQADGFLNELTGTLVPAAEEAAGFAPLWRGVAGYSLAGLFAVYAAYRSTLFTRVASASGSMWYDGWMDFAERTPFAAGVTHAYFSVGAKEKKTRNPRMQPVEDNTRAMEALFAVRGARSAFELNPGNHFVDAEKRLSAAVAFLSNSCSEEKSP